MVEVLGLRHCGEVSELSLYGQNVPLERQSRHIAEASLSDLDSHMRSGRVQIGRSARAIAWRTHFLSGLTVRILPEPLSLFARSTQVRSCGHRSMGELDAPEAANTNLDPT